MGLELYAHNREAYERAVEMMAGCGKAAVVHPTGTGKSFIGFELARRHAAMRVLWLTPSEYIVRTQLENWEKAGAEACGNIQFVTYSKLMLLAEDELALLCPEYIVLDEFHRCGAEKWGQGVQRLLAAYPRAGLLGLSATNVRYLDNRRDMAQELFEGHIASYMTLGEAVVRGILPAPVYVSSVYSYRQSLEAYEKKVKAVRGAGQGAQSARYLEALRRALEKADGLPRIIARHIPNKEGRYICFCAGFAHMRSMMEAAREWFAPVDAAPHIYSVYTDAPDASEDFQRFKADGSEHLKLLFCIDMLNEGIHVEGVDGVFMFRPTVSPIIYKQQLGRALAAGAKHAPVIFDVVNNFENLYSISALQEEMETAVQQLYTEGRLSEVVTERFTLIDEVQECRVLFEKLNESLRSGWQQYYEAAKAYAQKHGNLLVPRRFKTEDGLALGEWLSTQRRVYAGLAPGTLTAQQVQALDQIGMQWENRLELAWERGYAHARQYYREHGDLQVPARYVAQDGFALGKWITNCRQQRAGNASRTVLSAQRIARLDAIGMQWSPFSLRWEQNYLAAAEYYAKHGHLNVPLAYRTKDGLALGKWILKQRAVRSGTMAGAKLTQEQTARLDAIGMQWQTKAQQHWDKCYEAAREYYSRHGDLKLPAGYKTADGLALGRWVRRQQAALARMGPGRSGAADGRLGRLAELGLR